MGEGKERSEAVSYAASMGEGKREYSVQLQWSRGRREKGETVFYMQLQWSGERRGEETVFDAAPEKKEAVVGGSILWRSGGRGEEELASEKGGTFYAALYRKEGRGRQFMQSQWSREGRGREGDFFVV